MNVFITFSYPHKHFVCLLQGIFYFFSAEYCFSTSNCEFFASICMYKKRTCHEIVAKSLVFFQLLF